MIQTRNNPALRSMLAAMLALTLLTPFLSGFHLLLEAGNASCAMRCCKTAKAVCHRQHHGANHQAPLWTASPKCPSGCGLIVSLPGPVDPGLTAETDATAPSVSASHAPRPLQPADFQSSPEFSLFERPPPSFA